MIKLIQIEFYVSFISRRLNLLPQSFALRSADAVIGLSAH